MSIQNGGLQCEIDVITNSSYKRVESVMKKILKQIFTGLN